MAMHAGHLPQDENSNILYGGVPVGFKTNGSMAQKKGGGLAGRKALNNISNSGKPSALQASKKHNSMNVIPIGEDLGVSKTTFPIGAKTNNNVFKAPKKAQAAGGRKALSDVTNKGKPFGRPVLTKKGQNTKLIAVAEEENLLDNILEEGFLHNHEECIKAERRALDRDWKTVLGLDDDLSVQAVAPCLPLSKKSKDESPVMIFEMEEELMFEDRSRQFQKTEFLSGVNSPVFGSPRSPKLHYMDFGSPNFELLESPKLLK